MELKENRDLVIALKQAKAEKEIMLPRLFEMLKSRKKDISMSTLKRVFKEGSEDNDSFNYSSTLKPIAEILLDDDDESFISNEVANLRAELKEKDGIIDKLKLQIDSLYKEIHLIREEESKRLEFMKNQIELKDKRMDTKDELIQRVMDRNDKKDAAIQGLIEENKKLDESLRDLMSRCQLCDKKV